jgi:hypothetical protein
LVGWLGSVVVETDKDSAKWNWLDYVSVLYNISVLITNGNNPASPS